MDVAQKKCQVVMKKMNLGERTMHRCVIPVKKLRFSDNRTEHRVRLPKRVICPVQLHKLRVLLRKLSSRRLDVQQEAARETEHTSESMLSRVQLQKLQVLLHKLNVKESPSMRSSMLGDKDKLRNLRVLLRKLNPENGANSGSCVRIGSSKCQGEQQLRTHLQDLKVLLKKLKPTQSRSFIVDNGKVSKVQLQKFNILLRKVKLNQARKQGKGPHLKVKLSQTTKDNLHNHSEVKLSNTGGVKPQPVMDSASATQPSCSNPHVPSDMNRRRFRVQLKRLKLKREIQERLDHTIFIDDKLGFVVNPYLIPGFHGSRMLNRTQVKVLKIGRRSRASRCRVRIRKLQL